MRQLFYILILSLIPSALLAQSQEEEDKSYIAGLIEDNLSGASREVNIVGFKGALSSEATIELLTVADAEGVWLSVEDVVMQWNRAALLRGRIDVRELTAARIEVLRAPVSEDTAPSPEATPFALPELPVGISLGQLNVDEIALGPSFLGEPVSVQLTGSAELRRGDGTATIIATRLGEKIGVFEIDGSYANATRVLALKLNLDEGADGIVSRLIDLPGRPAVRLAIEGTAPIDDYAATLALATDGQDRLNGSFGLTESDAGRLISLDIAGDVSPLFVPEYRAFFGDNTSLTAQARQFTDGRIDVSSLALNARRLTLNGALRIGAQGWPELIRLSGGIAAEDGVPVLLPLSGPKTYVDGATLDINYDALAGEDWTAEIAIDGFDRPGLGIERLSLDGGGTIRQGEGDQIGAVTASLRYGADGLALDDAGAAQAFGDTVSGVFEASRTEGEPTEISRFTLTGPGLEAEANATIGGPRSGFQTRTSVLLTVQALERFSTLAGRDLGGAAELSVLGDLTPLDGLFNLILTGRTNDLTLGIAQADAVLAGAGNIAANLVRDTQGTRLEALSVATDAADIRARAVLTSAGSTATFQAALADLGLVVDNINGPARLGGSADIDADGVIAFDVAGTVPDARISTSGTVTPAEAGQIIAATATLNIDDLATYSGLAQRPLSGASALDVTGTLQTADMQFTAEIGARTRALQVGIVQVDPLLAGNGQIAMQVVGTVSDNYALSDLSIRTPALSVTGDAAYQAGGAASADLAVRIADARLIEPTFSGPISLTAAATRDAEQNGQIDLAISGPQTSVTLDATVAPPAQDYAITGDLTAQLGDLRLYRALVGRPLSGAVDLTAKGTVIPDLSGFDLTTSIRSEDLAIGNPTADVLLRGTGRINASAALADGTLVISTLEATTPNVTFVGALNGNAGAGQGRFNAALRDVGILTDQISGPVRSKGTASLDSDGNWGINATGTGPGGIAMQANGTVSSGGIFNLAIDGTAPLGLANVAIAPRSISGTARIDVGINGPAALSSLSGQVSIDGARLALPTFSQALTDIRGGVSLANSTAQVDVRANVETGGTLSITGPVTLQGTRTADVTARLDSVVLQNPDLYSTTIDGEIRLAGPLQGGATVRGRLDLGQTDIQVPSSSISALGELPNVVHVGESRAVRQTLQRAGVSLNGGPAEGTGASGPAYPLDIVINAPSRIFIRGRGLDAELGGRLSLGGTTSNVIPVGRFELLRGRIDILQQRFDLTEGSASLQGDFEPYIRLVATTQASTGTTVNIIVEGPATAPEVRFESTPELPQDEVLSQLIFGRNLESISPLQAVQLASAVSTLAGRGGGALDRLRENIGLDDFDVTTAEDGTAAVRAGKYLSENVYTDVIITSEGDTEINLNLDITSEITAKGAVGQEGGTSIGIFFERDY